MPRALGRELDLMLGRAGGFLTHLMPTNLRFRNQRVCQMVDTVDHSSDKGQSLIQISDLLGLKQPATELVRAITRGVGSFCEPWLRARNARADIQTFELWKTALASPRELPPNVDLTLADRAAIRFRSDELQRQTNREAVAIEAAKSARSEVESYERHIVKSQIEDDWIDQFWKLAENVSDEKMRALWGKILARQTLSTHKYSPRTLLTVSVLGTDEARELARIASFAILYRSPFRRAPQGCIMRAFAKSSINSLKEINENINLLIGECNEESFGPMGIFIESGWAHEIHCEMEGNFARLQCANAELQVRRFSSDDIRTNSQNKQYVYLGSGIGVSNMGMEIISLVSAEINHDFLDMILTGLKSMKLEWQLRYT